MQGGFDTSVLQPSNSKVAQAVSTPSVRRRIARDDVSPLWSVYSSEGFRLSNQLDCTNPSSKRSTSHSISRRLSAGKPRPGNVGQACGHAFKSTGISRIPDKLHQIDSCPSKNRDLSWHCLGPLAKPKVSSARNVCLSCQKAGPCFENRQNIAEGTTESCRLAEFCQFRGPSRETESSRISEVSQFLARGSDDDQIQYSVSGKGRNALVATKSILAHTNTCTTADAFSGHRCVRYSMGSSNRQPQNIWHLGLRRETLTLQSKGNVSYLQDSRIPCAAYGTEFCVNSVGQSDCGCVSSQRGRDQVAKSNESGAKDFPNTRPPSDSLENPIHSREVQHPSRLPLEAPRARGMAFTTGVYNKDLCEDGNTGNRLICIQNGASRSELRNSGLQRSQRDVPRCVQRDLEFFACLDIPTSISNSQSADASQSGHGVVSDCGAPVGESVLETRSQGSGHCSPVHIDEAESVSHRHDNGLATTSNSGFNSRDLEVWGWAEKIKSWDSSQIDLLKSSWRPSTRKTYQVAWNRWKSWAHQHNVNLTNPQGSDLAQFLADLYLKDHFSYNTILLHKSVVSTLCNAELSGKLSENVLVKHILKSISLKNPKATKPPVWDIKVLTSYLSHYPINYNSVFHIVRHAASLLILCSGRRIHDLTLLRVDDDHCVIGNDYITLWPEFGSKTDCSQYRQSGWRLISNPQNQNLNPVYWLKKTIEVLNERRSKSGSNNLFITLRGSPAPASRTMIAGWIKSIMKQAGIEATPGSMRSAVSSSNWLNNFPLDEILARGNWKSDKTFHNYYRREVLTSKPNRSTITSLFHPIT